MDENLPISQDINDFAISVAGKMDKLEVAMLQQPQVECPVYHHLSPGLYIREVNMPAGIVALGHYQKTEHLNIFLKGRVSMVGDNGEVTELRAPMIFTGHPGRKCGYIHEDVVWLNIYPTTETDIETLENTFVDKSDNWKSIQSLSIASRIADREDYYKALSEYGISEDDVRRQSENESDMIPFPSGSYGVGVFDSCIEGRGLFATSPFKIGDIIAPARIGVNRTPAGRFTNHSAAPNAEFVSIGNDIVLVATSDIAGCHGGQLGHEITVDYRKTMELVGGKKCQA